MNKASRNEKENYRPVRIHQIYQKSLNVDMLLSKYHCRFRRGFSTQHCLLAIIEKLRKGLDGGGLQPLF